MRKNKHQKRNKSAVEKAILNILLVISIIAMMVSIYKIIIWILDTKESDKIVEEISDSIVIEKEDETEEEKYNIDFEALKETNKDTVAWIKIKGTNIEYPIVKGNNNDYYLTHSFDKSKNVSGWIFADCKNKFDGTDKNIIIYGHNMKNGSMFGTLKNTLSAEWYQNEENRKIIFITEKGQYEYEVFSIYQIEAEKYNNSTEFSSSEKFQEYIDSAKKMSIYNFNVDITSNENILTLSTCANNDKYRIIVHAKEANSISFGAETIIEQINY